MNVKLKVLTAGVLFFTGQAAFAQKKASDTTASKEIQEVVVLGYSKTATKAKSVAASTTISSEMLENRPNVSFLNSIQGAAPGITINSTSGSPGSGKIDVMVRGRATLGASTDPLYVIDGLATSGNQFRNLNPNDIETLSVLRDAAATSIYGNRGANGVVIITTKSGKFNSGLKVSYDALTSFSSYPKADYNLADSHDLLKIQRSIGAGLGAGMTDAQIANYATNTDWNKEFYRTGISSQHNVGLRFGGENIAVYSSLGYLDNEGVVKSTDFKRFTFRNNINGKSKNGKFTYNSQLAVGYSVRHQLDQEENGANINSNVVQNALFAPVMSPATLTPYPFVNGQDMFNQIKGVTTGRSAWILQDNMRGGIQNKYTETSILANVSGNYKLTDWLSVGNKTGIDYKEADREFARDPRGYLSVNVANSQSAEFGGTETLSNFKDVTISSVTNLTFDKTFGDHQLTVAAYLDYIKGHYIGKSQSQDGLNPLNWVLGAGTGYVPFNAATPNLYQKRASAQKNNAGTLAYFATLDYDFASKYGLSAVIRRDGSFRFSKDNRWETFWSVAGRWNLDKENFLADSSVRMLKLRASYGTQGNQNLYVPTNNMNPLFVNPNIIRSTMSTGAGYQSVAGYRLGVIPNIDIKWEKVSQFNAGVDFSIFNGVLEGNFDYYIKTTKDLFNWIPMTAAMGSNDLIDPYRIRGNNGELKNTGVEGTLKYNIIRKQDLSLSIFANTAYNKNKIVSLPNPDLAGDNVHAPGGPAFQWQLYHYAGVNPETGEQQFIGKDGNITEEPTNDDRILTGKSVLPNLTGGFGMDIDVKGFFASVLFSFQKGGYQYDNLYSWIMDPTTVPNYNGSADLLNSWTPTNKVTDIPSLKANNMDLSGSSDRFLYKTDFIRLKNISIGYNLTKKALGNIPVNSVKIFAQAENIVTWTNWRGFDPEPIGSYSLGVYPNPKTVSVGFNVEF